MYIGRCAYLIEHFPTDWDGIFQKRSTRYYLENIPATLFFEYAQVKPIAIQLRNISRTGILINIGQHLELYQGESILIEISMARLKMESLMNQPPLKIWCQVRRRKPGPVKNMSPTLEFGLEFTQASEEQQLVLQNILAQLR